MRTGGQTTDARGGFAESGGNDAEFGRSGVQTGKIKNTTTDTNTEYRVALTPDNADTKDYGVDIDREIRRFSANTKSGIKYKELSNGNVKSEIMRAYDFFDNGDYDMGWDTLVALGKSLYKKTDEGGAETFGKNFERYFEQRYKYGMYIRATKGTYAQADSDMKTFITNANSFGSVVRCNRG